ncbi:glyoxylate/hydroxypyruvate reductase A [Pseudomaricurvus alcaniphilus]|uniref:2-hydroxyacid dehydrogenase n=1 Tax=Pseudomaricurvus alcaniphilus TaxID=1166482 RepID=UPI00140CABB4|nr:glyoxylate/hydroxypyruvate reductase A [Pseudomaricurvus alcaniphilus]NHN37868.1 glyoxylate/hydroxypyruvate reductase A [Pseudomaricurvus alcaniphilus]
MPELSFHLWPDVGDPEAVEFLVAWLPPDNMLELFPNLRVVFSVGAGVDHFDLSAFPPQLQLVRMLDPGIAQGMVEYVTLGTLALHRDMPRFLQQQRQQQWQAQPWVPAQQRRVGVMGLGNLGRAVIAQLRSLGFQLNGWSRSAHQLQGVTCFAGWEQLPDFLQQTDLLICLLPLTAETRHILCARNFNHLPAGAALINAGRGGHLQEEDLLAALDSGQLGAAMLDVLQEEPPGYSHPFWQHPKIWLTPHIAGVTSHDSGCDVLLDNVRRFRQGLPMHGAVDLSRGY